MNGTFKTRYRIKGRFLGGEPTIYAYICAYDDADATLKFQGFIVPPMPGWTNLVMERVDITEVARVIAYEKEKESPQDNQRPPTPLPHP